VACSFIVSFVIPKFEEVIEFGRSQIFMGEIPEIFNHRIRIRRGDHNAFNTVVIVFGISLFCLQIGERSDIAFFA
jgi:hypothetical protein